LEINNLCFGQRFALIPGITEFLGWVMNTMDAAGAKNFLVWMAIWVGALMVLLPALSGK
jgi:hypothetical protein